MNNYLFVNPISAITLGFELLSLIALAIVIIIAIVVIVVLNKKEVDPNEQTHEFDPEEIAKKSQNTGLAKPKKTSRASGESECDFEIEEELEKSVDIDELLDEAIEEEDEVLEPAEEMVEAKEDEVSEPVAEEAVEAKEEVLEPVAKEVVEAKEDEVSEPVTEEAVEAKEDKKSSDKEESSKDDKIIVAGGTDIDKEYDSSIHGKYVIHEAKGEYKYPKYIFELYANNGTLLYQSQKYASLQGCKAAIKTFRKNVTENDFVIEKTDNNKYKYVLTKGKSVYSGKEYSTEQAALSGVESVKRFSQSEIVETD